MRAASEQRFAPEQCHDFIEPDALLNVFRALQSVLQIAGDTLMGKEPRILKYVANTSLMRVHRDARTSIDERRSVESHVPRIGFEQARDQIDRRRFAAS